jgi:hypothetical protein
MGKSQRDKGSRCEREIVDRHKAINVPAERYLLSGASRFRGSGHDIDLYPFGRVRLLMIHSPQRLRIGLAFSLSFGNRTRMRTGDPILSSVYSKSGSVTSSAATPTSTKYC